MSRNKIRRKIMSLQEKLKTIESKNYYHQIEDMQEVRERIERLKLLA